jgi:enoyl-CoA hydratase
LPATPARHAVASGFVETEDFQAAFRAFLARRKPVWHGR